MAAPSFACTLRKGSAGALVTAVPWVDLVRVRGFTANPNTCTSSTCAQKWSTPSTHRKVNRATREYQKTKKNQILISACVPKCVTVWSADPSRRTCVTGWETRGTPLSHTFASKKKRRLAQALAPISAGISADSRRLAPAFYCVSRR